jgi:hypothetical protein
MTDPVWAEGQEQEERGVRVLRPAFMRASAKMSAFYAGLVEAKRVSPLFPVMGQLARAPWDDFASEITEAWVPLSARVIRGAVRDATARAEKVDSRDVEALAQRWAAENALTMARRLARSTREAAQLMIAEQISGGLTETEVAEALRDQIGLSPKQVGALNRQRALLRRRGLPEDQITVTLARRAAGMRRQRAEAIARTEVNAARNFGTLEAYKQMRRDGELPVGQRKRWVLVGSACKVCKAIAAEGDVPLNQPFRSPLQGTVLQAPPAHPNCRCSIKLV